MTNTENVKRLVLYVGLPIALVMASNMVAGAYDSTWISTGQPVSASQLKANLDELDSRLTALEGRAPAVSFSQITGPSIAATSTNSGSCMTTKKHVIVLATGTATLAASSVYVQVALNVDGVQAASAYSQASGSRVVVPTMTAYLDNASVGSHAVQIANLQGAQFDNRDFWSITCVELP